MRWLLFTLSAIAVASCTTGEDPIPTGPVGAGDGGVIESGTGGGAGDASTSPDASSGAATDSLYFGACLTVMAGGNLDKVLRFYTQAKFTPDPGAGTGKLTLNLTPLKVGPGGGPPTTILASGTVGTTTTIDSVATNASGVYSTPAGTITISGEANPISGRAMIIEVATLPGRFGSARFCSQLRGHVVQPTDLALEGADNTCIYVPVKEGAPVPTLTAADFSAGCVLD